MKNRTYVRYVKPYIQPPQLQGFGYQEAYPVEGYDWVPEDMEEKLRHEIVVKDPWSKLIFRCKWVEVNAISVLVPGLDRIFLDSEDGDRIAELMKRTGKTESEVIKEALKHYDDLVRIADLMADIPN